MVERNKCEQINFGDGPIGCAPVVIRRDSKGYPLCDDGSIDWELTAKEKQDFADKWEAKNAETKKRNRMTHLTPKKKKRK